MKTNPNLNLFVGPSHSGKSTDAKALADSETKIRLSADQIRSSIRCYNKDNPEHRRIRDHIFEISLDAYLSSSEFDIFCEIPRSLISMVGAYINKAQDQYGFKARIIFLDATTEKLLERFNKSIQHSKNKGFLLAINKEEDFLNNLKESRELITEIQKIPLIQEVLQITFDTTATTSEMLIQQTDGWLYSLDRKL